MLKKVRCLKQPIQNAHLSVSYFKPATGTLMIWVVNELPPLGKGRRSFQVFEVVCSVHVVSLEGDHLEDRRFHSVFVNTSCFANIVFFPLKLIYSGAGGYWKKTLRASSFAEIRIKRWANWIRRCLYVPFDGDDPRDCHTYQDVVPWSARNSMWCFVGMVSAESLDVHCCLISSRIVISHW